jgi:hypothetical protein
MLLGDLPAARRNCTLFGLPITSEMRQAATTEGADHPMVGSMTHHVLQKRGSFGAATLLEDLREDCCVT